jgi:c-di-AMP phosphodiesterase-like protein
MRNRAKCRLCGDILESFHEHDRVECGCGEITISGGQVRYEVAYRNIENLLRLDDNDNEIAVRMNAAQERREHLLYSLKNYTAYEKNGDDAELVQKKEFVTALEIIYELFRGMNGQIK